MRARAALPFIALLLAAEAGAAAAANLVTNGSFEAPPVTSGLAYTDHLPGSAGLTGWSISNATVSQVRSDYALNPGYIFTAKDGIVSLDLAGFSDNQPALVSQTITTTVGMAYALRFWVGNISGGFFGTQTSIGVEFGSGGTNFSCTNSQPGAQISWLECGTQFVATQASTSIGFRNLDPNTDFSALIDNVSVEQVAAVGQVPEPEGWAMLIVGLGLVGGIARRQDRGARSRSRHQSSASSR